MGRKDHQCHRCGKSFVRLEHLNRHERSHTKEKPYRCGLCPRAFTRRDLLTRHHRLCHLPGEDVHQPAQTTPGSVTPSNDIDIPAALTQTTDQQLSEIPNDDMYNPQENLALPTRMQPLSEGVNQLQQTPILPEDSTPDMLETISTDLFDHYDWSMVFQDDNFADIYDPVSFAEPVHALNHQQSSLRDNLRPSTSLAALAMPTQQPDTAFGDLSRFGSRLPSLEPEEEQHPEGDRSEHPSPWTSANPRRAPLEVNAECRHIVLMKLSDFSDVIPPGFELPSRHALNRFLAMYITGFNEHNPVIHLPTTSLDSVAVELFLSIVSVGARYAHEKETCLELFYAAQAITFERIKRWEDGRKTLGSHNIAMSFAMQTSTGTDATDWTHVQVMQALVLMTGAIVFGKTPGAGSRESALCRATLGTMIREAAMSDIHPTSEASWGEWIKAETIKRIILVAFTLFNLQTIQLDIAPSLWWSEIKLDLPCSEETWNATSAENWRLARERAAIEAPVQDTMADLFNHERHSFRPCFSSLGGYFLIHAILQGMWIMQQMTPIQANSQGEKLLNREQTERALRHWRKGWEQNQESSMNPVNPSGPIAFTSTALLRLAYVRLTATSRIIPSLSSWNPSLIAIKFWQTPKVARSEMATRAALHCAHALSIPVKIGLNFVAHTQSFYWACQHALSSLECALFLSKWLETVTDPDLQKTLSSQEALVVEFVVQIVSETGFRTSRDSLLADNQRLSRIVVQIWGRMFPEAGVWEVVDLVARVFKACSDLVQTV